MGRGTEFRFKFVKDSGNSASAKRGWCSGSCQRAGGEGGHKGGGGDQGQQGHVDGGAGGKAGLILCIKSIQQMKFSQKNMFALHSEWKDE